MLLLTIKTHTWVDLEPDDPLIDISYEMKMYGCKHAPPLGWDQVHLLQLSLRNATQCINI